MATIKKRDLLNLWNIVQQIKADDNTPAKFVYGITKNKKLMVDEIEALKVLFADEPMYVLYEQERVKLCNDLADKDEEGNTKIVNNNFQITENRERFDAELLQLREKYKDAIEKNDAKIKEIENILDEDINVDFYQIDIDYFPNGITVDEMEHLSILVKE